MHACAMLVLSFRIIVTIIMFFNGFSSRLLIADTFNNWILELGLIGN